MTGPSTSLQEQLATVRALLAEHNPELLLAVAEVDRTLIRAWLALDPWERARYAFEHAAAIAELKTWRRPA